MLKQFKVVILADEGGGGFFGHVANVSGKDKGDALLDALMDYVKSGGNLDTVRTKVTEIVAPTPHLDAPKTSRTLLGLHASP